MPPNADETRAQLIRAAEKLFAERGVDGVSLREVNREAAQRNASALQYHFGDRDGLVRAILTRHDPPIEQRRHALLDDIERDGACELHRLSAALVVPTAEKLSDRDGGRDYLRIVAQLLHRYRPSRRSRDDDPSASVNRWRTMVAPAMNPLSVDPLHSRFTARRIMSVELARRAEIPQRRDDRLFVSHLIDLVTAILGAPISDQTLALLDERAGRVGPGDATQADPRR